MKESDLKELGFKKVTVYPEESGDNEIYHYYVYDFKRAYNLSLISCDSGVAKKKGKWFVEMWDSKLKPFKDKREIASFIKIIKGL